MGIHVNTGSQEWHNLICEIASEGLLGGVVVLNDLHLANRIRGAGAEWVIVREYDLEYQPDLLGEPGDIDIGYSWWQDRRSRYLDNGLDRRCYIQALNEKNHPRDGYFYRGIVEAAAQDGFKMGIFGDSHGCPAGDTFEPAWKLRVDSRCMEVAKATGAIYVYHSYGALHNNKESDDPGSAIWYDDQGREIRRDDVAWTYYGGRDQLAYERFVPVSQRIPIVYGEAGPSDAAFRGPIQVINDLRGYRERLRGNPYVKAVCYWAVGQQSPWEFSNFGTALPAIRDWLRTR